MYLKSIQVQGFKSFANKIKFEFHEGITGIVGPNGSGKSNVADAVRWVLGEQKIKQLRGGKMEDVIFAGTENRKPLGYADVEITFDNSDHQLAIEYEEVTVSRRLYRSGESEYRINKAICRLRDIHELFYDTGIGKEGYSIIGQGQIDKILSGKADERRELFDEAAGIVKFKRRKAETLKRLESQKQNLVRVTDILTELEKQVKPLERQSANAKEFLKLKEELKNYDLQVFLQEIGKIQEQLNELLQNKEKAKNELVFHQKELDEMKETYDKLETYLEELTHSMDEKKNLHSQAELEKQKLDGEIKVLYEQISTSQANEEHYTNRLTAIEADLQKYTEEKEDYVSSKKDLFDLSKNAGKLQSAADREYALIAGKIISLNETIEEKKQKLIRILNEETTVKTKLQHYETMLEQVSIRKTEMAQKMEKFQNDKELQDKIMEELVLELKKVSGEIADNTDRQELLENEIKSLKQETQNYRQKQDENVSGFHRLNSNLETLKNLTERYEGYGNSIRRIMELKEKKKGIIGVVADIIKVEKKYEVAIETALGGSIQNVVTDNENTAKEVIEYLKKNKFGRATFLPLNSIANKTGFNQDRVFQEKGVIGLASDLVTIDKMCENIGKYLLGRIVVVDTIDNAIALARKFNYTLRIVTLEGELFNAGGSISGGAFKNNSNLLGRRREIEELEKEIEKSKQERQILAEKIQQNEQDIAAKRAEIEKIRLLLSEQFLLQNTAKMNLNKAQEKKQELNQDYEEFCQENDGIHEQIDEIQTNHNNLEKELNQWEKENKQIEEEIASLQKQLEDEKVEEAKKLKDNEKLKLDLSGISQKLEFLTENLERVETEIIRLQKEKEEILQAKALAQNSSREKEAFIDEKKKQVEAFEQKIAGLSGEIQKLQEEKNGQSKEQKEFFGKREKLTSQIAELDKEIYRLNTHEEKLEESKEKQITYMWDEYELTYGAVKEQGIELTKQLPELKKLTSGLRQKIKSLGTVNLDSIEEYEQVSERYQFLKAQNDDLVDAKEDLEKIIMELDTGMRKQFHEKFEDIRREFDKVFKILFGGGKGSIQLGDSEDVLEAEITIISQPPGKKLQNMMQLSGGEKALTAIALLFAIQNLKPSPFCLLDEIEAALDASNVVRYAKYLHKLTDHTQFIVITHRRGTMNAADRLYGITMQEKGISTLVSVDLIESQLEKKVDS